MKDLLTSAVIFTVGAIIGSAVTYKMLKTKYENIAQEEIDSVKEVFSRMHSESANEEEEAEEAEPTQQKGANGKANVKEYATIIKDSGYVNYSDSNNIKKEESNVNKPRVIPPEEFGEEDYAVISLNYYADGVLADDWDKVIEDVENTVGEDFANHFGEYEDDSVFVRNDELETDYEILRDTRNFSDVVNKNAHPEEDE